MSDPKMSGTIGWESPSNIALVKYWSKKKNQIPCNPSLSMTLKNAVTKTKISYSPASSGKSLRFKLAGRPMPEFEKRILNFMDGIAEDFPFLADYSFEIDSENTFPHSTGIASSAAAMSALALCFCSMEEVVTGTKFDKSDFFQKASYIARLGSGSASRSVYGSYAAWGDSSAFSKASDDYAVPFSKYIHPVFEDYQDFILLVSSATKKVSSTSGHQLMKAHPYAAARFSQAHSNFERMLGILRSGDLDNFAEIVENEALSLHGLMMNSTPSFTLLKPNTLEIIERVRNYRQKSKTPLSFTLDAGPNVHLLFPKSEYKVVKTFVDEELAVLLENGKYLEDEKGNGPKQLIFT